LTSSRAFSWLLRAVWTLAACLLPALGGCRLDMHVQPRYNPYSPSDFFTDGRSERPPVPGTVARNAVIEGPDLVVTTGMLDGREVDAFPFPVTRAVLDRGRDRYNIFCTPCHGWAGDGDGMIVQRGFQQPPSYHSDRLRQAPDGHFFSVITNGIGAMYPYGYRILPRDRWAIVAYIRALQLSRHASIDDVPADERSKLMNETP
jgi:hypothetical protein